MATIEREDREERERTLTEQVVERCYNIERGDLSDAAVTRAHTLFLDFLGVTLGSANGPESSRIARDFATTVYGDGEATVVGEARGAPVPAAAFANGTVAHGIELDDTHSGASIHLGTVVFPVALAVGETEAATGTEFLEASVAGYELMVRIGRAADPAALYARGFHPTATCGVFGAALTAARLKGLDLETTVQAVGIAGAFASGNLEYLSDGSLSKRIQPGIAAQAGVTAAELAARGYTGPRTVLEGENGFLQGYSDGSDPDRLLDDGDGELAIAQTGIKPHACCRYNQTPIDIAVGLVAEHDLSPDEIEGVNVEIVGPALPIVAEPRAAKIAPKTDTDAQFSVQYSVAVAIHEGKAFLEQFQDPYLSDPDVRDLASRVTVERAPDLEETFPEFWPARLTITTTDGTEYEGSLDTCSGDPSNPLSEEALLGKFEALAGRQLDATETDELAALAGDLDAVGDVAELTAFLRA
jgi:2-methylcitrate dehydratase PrpD